MNEQTTEKKTYRNAPLADKEYYAKPRWHEVAISEKSGNLCLTVLWNVCDKDGHPGNFDPATGAETPLPQGMDGWEAASKTYVIAFADEAKNLAKCKGKDLEYLKDVCPKTYNAMKSILKWCPEWDVRRVMWFTDCRETFYANVVRITVVHEEWNGTMRAKVKYTNNRERMAKEVDTTEVRGKIRSSFGGFFDVAESAPAPRKSSAASAESAKAPPAPPAPPALAPAPRRQCTKNDAWVAFCGSPAFGVAKTDEWFKMVKAFGKKESEFTGDDWAKLKADIDETPPF